ncbi:hypothetical protein [Pontibacter ruber]|uniref:Uncharacterized protein n=1 Tax=Pontibacter ruber TaxID=1343895 RepID=A0ABW5CT87_9BACT|nr:hypothetical protein [Pontibacter ruber]
MGILLGISDWVYADFYRQMPYEVKSKLPANVTVWSAGHWGWQWYSKDAGMQEYETDSSRVRVNDYIVAPKHIPLQVVNEKLALEEVQRIVPPATPLTYFSTGLFASFYTSDYLVAPWPCR